MKRQILFIVLLGFGLMLVAGGLSAQQDDPAREVPLVCDKFTDSPTAERVSYYMGEGVAYFRAGELARANDSFSCIVEQIDSRYALGFASRGVVYTAQRDYVEAIEDYGSAIGTDSSLAGAYNNRGIAYAALREFDEAVSDFSRALDAQAEYNLALVNRGIVYAELGQFTDAIADLERAIENSGIDRAVADLRRPDRRGDDPLPVYDRIDAHVYAVLGIVYSEFALANYQDYLLLTDPFGDRRIQSAAGALESRANFDLRLDDISWLLAAEFIPGG
ncbi:MAG: tetratricopeptide repeat protein [Chloroflexi bacterium]|nr:tetratricopeptide repeat protein [Chloroflexota bacterium]